MLIKDAQRCAIMEHIEEYCKTDISPMAHASGRYSDFVTVSAYPFLPGNPSAQFSWVTAKHITETSKIFKLG